MADVAAVLADLTAETAELDALVAPLPAADWARATPAAGWTIAHQIGHLAWTDDTSTLAATDADRFAALIGEVVQAPGTYVDDAAATRADQPPPVLLDTWRAGRIALVEALAAVPAGVKLPWFGPPMSATSMATARLMETWAHGQDVADALGVDRPATDRIRHVAHIGVRTHGFSFLIRDLEPPTEPVRVELRAPSGELWTWGPEDADQRVTGPALDFCLLVTQRRHRDDLAVVATGAGANAWLDVAQAFAGAPRTGPGEERMTAPLRIGNASGFYGDRASAMYEMLSGGELDVLTGDYLAELTMLILGRDRMKDANLGYAKTFLRHLETSLGLALEQGVKIVANAGGLNPGGLANAVRVLADSLGLDVCVAHVEGDDLRGRAGELGLGEPLAANAYLGAWGIADCLRAGADIVVTGRVTDASLVVGPAAAHFGWSRTDHDALAGAVVAGHVVECGPQATGGNYAFFTELPALDKPLGFPIAEVHADGTSVITKHPGTGGAVTVGTVTAQLLYEITGARYAGPDATARFDTIELSDDGPDRVRISGVRGEAPPPTLKVGLNRLGGFRNAVTFVLTGLDIEAKAELVTAQLADLDATWTLARTDHADADVQEEAAALLHCVVRGSDPKIVGRAFSGRAIELALASYPGFHVTAPPSDAAPYGVFTAAYVPAGTVPHVAVHPDGTRVDIAPAGETLELDDVARPTVPPYAGGPTRRAPLGRVAGARSGDKGGSANVGLWARSDDAYAWLATYLTVDEFRRLLPETAHLPIQRHLLPNLRALNFVVEDVLGQGVAFNARHDPQAKAIGEWLRSRIVDVPEELLDA